MSPFTTIRKKQRYIALLLLSAICVSEASAFANPSAVSPAASTGSPPVAASASDYVDPFTGDFNYSVPLMTVPGPNGENVPITASYHAGIRMNQSASWLGLGWDYNPGEISRQVNGAPDDNNGKVSFSTSIEFGATTIHRKETAIYGSMYFNASGTPNYSLIPGITSYTGTVGSGTGVVCSRSDEHFASHDVYESSSNRLNVANSTAYLPFDQADYDNYSISGSGIQGSIQPYTESTILLKTGKSPGGLGTAGNIIKPMQFYFSRSADLSATTVESSSNRFKTGYFVRYLTNAQLNNSTTCDTAGFIDYRDTSATRRPSSDFEADGIGAYQVTTPGGVTYHYSLPVYSNDEQFISFGMTNSAIAPSKRVDIFRKHYKYASSWKLTAITGPDYVDNGNHIVDAADKGYWIAYDYSLWCNDYQWSSTPYGFKKDMKLRSADDQGRREYEQRGSVVTGSSQQYYLNRIRTATHTAWFVKSIRKDEQSMDPIYNSSHSPKPQLKLDRIILLRNEDAAVFGGSGTLPAVSGYSTSGCNPHSDLVHAGIYNANATAIDAASLKTVDFETDYSLCKKYYSNIASTVTAAPIIYDLSFFPAFTSIFSISNVRHDTIGYYHPSSVSSSTSDPDNAGGKLTLNKIKVYEEGKQLIYPSYDFSYNTSNNPDYDVDKVDIWGYYKSDYDAGTGKRSYYTSSTSKNYLDAWSLKTITTPLGGTISVNYESDEYVHENGHGRDFENLPYFIYLADSKSDNDSVRYANESDYWAYHGLWALISPTIPKQRTVFPAYASSCSTTVFSGVIHLVDDWNNNYTQYFPDMYTPGCTIDQNYNPTHASGSAYTEWGWTETWVTKAYGGGIRVKNITIADPESAQSYKQEYTYEDGLCTYKPDRFSISEYSLTDNLLQNERDNGPAMVGYGRVTAQTLSNTGLGNGKIQYNFNTNYSVSHISATRVESHSTPHYEPFYYCGCSSPSFQPINRCSVNHPDEYRIFDLSKTVGTFNGFGQLIKKSVFDKAGALLSYSKNYYKQISEISESYTKEAQGITYYTPHTYSHLCQVTPTYNIGTGLYTYNCTVNGNTINMIQTFTTSLSFTIQNNHYSRNYSVLDKTESYANGITTTSIINERDPISMQPLSSTVVDPTQGAITTTIKPAYTNTVSYSSMGLKSACPTCATNENMVSLVEEQRVIKQPVFRNSDGVISYNSASPGILMGASKQTYANTVYHRKYNTGTNRYESVSEAANTWLPYESYTALTNASTPSTTTSPTWKKTNTVTLFSTTNKALESEGMSGRKSAVKFGYKNLYPLASISDANYNCFGFTGFEDTINVGTGSSPVWHFGGEFSKGTMRMAGTPWIKPHTGYYVAAVPAGQFGPELQLSGFDYGRIYRASVWVHKNSPDNTALVMACDGSVGGTSTYNWQQVLKNDPNNIIVGDWILMSVQLTVPENYLPSGGSHGNGFGISVLNSGSTTAWFDDLMIRPVDAPITGTVYDPKTARVIATLDNENFASWFEYDAAGRVTATYVETRLGVKKTSETQYNFSRNN